MLNIIIVNYLSSDEINLNLKKYSIIDENIKKLIKFIIVDNSGEFKVNDGVNEENISVLKADNNLGYCGGNNLGYKYVNINNPDSDILICNPDVKIDFIQLNEMIKIISEKQDGLYSIPAVNEYNELLYYRIKQKGLLESYIIIKPDEPLVKTDYCPGSYIYIKNNTYKLDYLFDEKFFMYWEEVDLALRFKSVGLSSYMITNIGFIERHSNDKSRIYNAIYYHIRNAFLIRRKHKNVIPLLNFIYFLMIKFLVFSKKAFINKDIEIFKCFIKGLFHGICNKIGK
ncbi:glycosyltransferase family 2 protein [Photobacterium piscicola]|uniref:glycosyltransferase family 2 protein n=1 Tax=Photobacterium piscicola TaxID=1378299 RepID=UPI0037353F99